MDYSRHYTEESWARKIRSLPGKSATDLMDKAITLYALLKSSSTPAWAKAAIIAALGYFICPLDAIPDFLPPVGFVDDLAVMAAVLMNLQDRMTGTGKNVNITFIYTLRFFV